VDGARKDMAGTFHLSAHRKENEGRPLVMDSDRSPIYKADGTLYDGKAGRLYAGCFVHMHVELWAQDNQAGKGLRATLLGVMFAGDGDSFGGGARPDADAFGEPTLAEDDLG
jgi:hypothetical protein